MKVTALAGGVGGAKLAHGFSKIMAPDDFCVIVNTGDDFEHLGLYISPDIDTVMYTLAEISNRKTGWGRNEETFNTFKEIKNLNGPDWFLLGDKDLAHNLTRTHFLKDGYSLTEATHKLGSALGVEHPIFPMTDGKVRTIVETVELGEISFQEYFVKNKFEPIVKGFRFEGIAQAKPTEDVLKALEVSDLIVICPSNPYVSIAPIIALPEIKNILCKKNVIGVSPIIGGKAVKGPLGKLLREFGKEVNAMSVAEFYTEFIDIFIIDEHDFEREIQNLNSSIIIERQSILLPDIEARVRLAKNILEISKEKL